MAVAADGCAFSWGRGCEGQLGLGNREDVVVPSLVSFNEDGSQRSEAADGLPSKGVPASLRPKREVAGVAAGRLHSVLWDSNGRVYTAGCNDDGQVRVVM